MPQPPDQRLRMLVSSVALASTSLITGAFDDGRPSSRAPATASADSAIARSDQARRTDAPEIRIDSATRAELVAARAAVWRAYFEGDNPSWHLDAD